MNENLKEFQVLYIASASRSGSTILEHMLGGYEYVFNCGELRRIKDFYNKNEAAIQDPKNMVGCTCGNNVRNCEFWKKVGKESGLDFSKVNFSSQIPSVARSFFKLAYFIFGPYTTKWFSLKYGLFAKEIEAAENCFRIYSAISSVSNCRIIVDSSKMIHQFLMLKTARPGRVKLIALFRDGRAVSKSMIRGERKKTFKKGRYSSSWTHSKLFRKAVLSWVTSSLQILLFYFRVPKNSRYFIKYETFCNAPDTLINNLFSKFGIKGLKKEVKTSDSQSHAIGGSPSRFSDNFREVKIDERWRKDWSKEDNHIFTLYGYLVNRLLGYK